MKSKILKWASEKGILEHGDPKTQMLKIVEEVGEASQQILKQDTFKLMSELGDIQIALTILAELCNLDIDKCTKYSLRKNRDRKGQMKNGTFEKEAN